MPIGFFLGLERKRHLMNYGLGEKLILNILGLSTMNAKYIGMGRTLENLMLNLM